MFNLTPPSRGSELHQSNSLIDPTLPAYNDQYKLHLSKTSQELPLIQDMDSDSPISPTQSSSPTSPSDTPSTKIAPTTSTYRSVWGTTKSTGGRISIPRLSTATVPISRGRRITIHDLLMTPLNQSHMEDKTSLQAIMSRPMVTGSPSNRHGRNLSEPSNQFVDEDGDMLLCSPPPATPRRAVWEDTTTSPILGRLVGVPVQNCSNEQLEWSTTTSGRENENSALSQDRNCHEITPAGSTTSKASILPVRTPQRIHKSRGTFESAVSEESCNKLRKMSLIFSKSHSRSSTQRSSPNPPPQLDTSTSIKAQLKSTILHLGIPLVPLVSVSTGLAHPSFPRSILQYHLLTHDQLDSLATWYHQTIDNEHERYMYPAAIERPWAWSDLRLQRIAKETMSRYATNAVIEELTPDLATKRRRFGRFIGLRGCESPVLLQAEGGAGSDEDAEVLAERMEREWRSALQKAEEEERLQEKLWRGRW